MGATSQLGKWHVVSGNKTLFCMKLVSFVVLLIETVMISALPSCQTILLQNLTFFGGDLSECQCSLSCPLLLMLYYLTDPNFSRLLLISALQFSLMLVICPRFHCNLPYYLLRECGQDFAWLLKSHRPLLAGKWLHFPAPFALGSTVRLVLAKRVCKWKWCITCRRDKEAGLPSPWSSFTCYLSRGSWMDERRVEPQWKMGRKGSCWRPPGTPTLGYPWEGKYIFF